MQLSHGGRQCFPSLLGGAQPMAPSAVYDPSTKITPRAMDDAEIWTLSMPSQMLRERAFYAGFDGSRSNASNTAICKRVSYRPTRTGAMTTGEVDEERRFHFIEEIYEAMRKEL